VIKLEEGGIILGGDVVPVAAIGRHLEWVLGREKQPLVR